MTAATRAPLKTVVRRQRPAASDTSSHYHYYYLCVCTCVPVFVCECMCVSVCEWRSIPAAVHCLIVSSNYNIYGVIHFK